MDDQLVTLLAEHVVDTLLALVVGLLLVEGFAAVVAEEPVVVAVWGLLLLLVHGLGVCLLLLFLLQFGQYVVFQLLSLLLCLLSYAFLFFCLPFLNFLPLLLS